MALMNQEKRQVFVSLITLFIISGFFSCYFFIHVPDREVKLNERKFRVLSRIIENVNKKTESYLKNGANIIKHVRGSIKVEEMDSIRVKERDNIDSYIINKLNDSIEYNEEIIYEYLDTNKSEKLKSSSFYIDDSITPVTIKFHDTIKINGFFYNYSFKTDLKKFIEPLLTQWNVEFEKFIFIRSNNILYSSFPAGITIDLKKDILKTNKGFHTSSIETIEIGGISYKLFVHPFMFEENKTYILIGLIQKKQYVTEKMKIPHIVLIVILAGMVLFFLSIPFLKLFLISPNERLNIWDLRFLVPSLAFGLIIITLLCFGTGNFIMNRKYLRKKLECASDDTKNTFKKELDSAYTQLEKYDLLIAKSYSCQTKKNKCDNKNYTAEINLAGLPDKPKSEQFFKELSNINFQDTINKITSFNNFHLVYWIDTAGKQIFKMSTSGKTTPLISVNKRDYFKKIKNNQAWKIDSKKDSIFVESIISWNTGGKYAAISKSSCNKSMVIAMTTALHSIFRTDCQDTSIFCIINKKGDVLFHSDKKLNLQENFFKECISRKLDILEIDSAYFNAYYHNRNYHAYISKIYENVPLYLVTLENRDIFRKANLDIISRALVWLIFFYFLFLLLFSINKIWKSLIKLPSKLKNKLDYSRWWWPNPNKNHFYIKWIFWESGIGNVGFVFFLIFLLIGINLPPFVLGIVIFFIILFAITSILSFLKYMNPTSQSLNKSLYLYNYGLYIIIGLLMLSILPTIVIYSILYNQSELNLPDANQLLYLLFLVLIPIVLSLTFFLIRNSVYKVFDFNYLESGTFSKPDETILDKMLDAIGPNINKKCKILSIKDCNNFIETYKKGKTIPKDECILCYLNRARNHYSFEWNNYSDLEKHVLYDLAEDGLVNPKNTKPIITLYEKGALEFEKDDNRLRIADPIFCHYILSEGKAELLKTEDDEGNMGAWNKIRTPLILILIAIAVFVIIIQSGESNSSSSGDLGANVFKIIPVLTLLLSGIKVIADIISRRPKIPSKSQ